MKWISWTNVVLGVWLILAPFVLRYSSSRGASVEDFLLGSIVATFSLWRALGPETNTMRVVSGFVALVGIWVLLAPFAVPYNAVAVWNDTIIGPAIILLAGIRALVPVRQ